MSFTVVIQPRAARDLEEAYKWLAEQSSESADRWFNETLEAIHGLSTFPGRFPVAAESEVFDEEVRQLLSGNFRVLFTIIEDEVHIVHVRHVSRRRFGLL